MFKVGKIQKAYVIRFSDHGAYLSDELNGSSEVLLPNKFVPEGLKVDQELSVFIYYDSEQRLTATLQKVLMQVGEVGYLKVVGKMKSGYFLDMGIDKDVFLPFNEAKGELINDRRYLVTLYLNDEGYITSSMKIYNHLSENVDFQVDQQVKGVVYEIKDDMGAFVAVENQIHGFIPKHELYKEIKVGAKIDARITKIREDGKLNLSIKQKSSVQIFSDLEVVLNAIELNNGTLPLNDDSDPEEIRKRLNLSKRAFKRACGKLLKENKIEILEKGIKLV